LRHCDHGRFVERRLGELKNKGKIKSWQLDPSRSPEVMPYYNIDGKYLSYEDTGKLVLDLESGSR